MLTKIQKKRKVENNIIDKLTKLLPIFKPYNKNNELSVISISKINNT